MVIDKPGAYKISMEEYRRGGLCPKPTLSRSIIKDLIFRTPAHAFWNSPELNPDYQPDEGAGKFDIGNASHSILLEGIDNVVAIEADDWRTKAAKEARDQVRADGKIPLLAYQYEKVKICVQRAEMQIYGCPELGIKNLRQDGDSELSLFWKEEDTWLRARPDWCSKDRKLIIDLKFTEQSANPADLARNILSVGADIQSAFYVRGAEAVFGVNPHFVFIYVEIEKPYICSFVGLPPEWMDLGKNKVEFGLYAWRQCMATGFWPAYPNRVAYIDLPAWVVAAWESKSSEIGMGK